MDEAAAAAANDRDGKEENVEEGKVSFTGLFRYADRTDLLLILVGTVGALANGVSQPLTTVIFGDVIDAFGGATNDDVLRRVNKVSPAISVATSHCLGASKFDDLHIYSCQWLPSAIGSSSLLSAFGPRL